MSSSSLLSPRPRTLGAQPCVELGTSGCTHHENDLGGDGSMVVRESAVQTETLVLLDYQLDDLCHLRSCFVLVKAKGPISSLYRQSTPVSTWDGTLSDSDVVRRRAASLIWSTPRH